MDNKDNKFLGILFTLKKRMQSINEDDSNNYQYHALGYYDGLDINVVDKWYELRPRGLHDLNLQVNLKLPFIDQYTIRAIMPQNREDLNKEGFCYSFWENLNPNIDFTEYELETRKRFPYITMSVVNLSEKYVEENSDLISLQEGIIDAIKKTAAKQKVGLEELHCAVFPSIGYSDFVILCMTDNLKKASDVIEALRGSSSDPRNNIVSNCYSVCGLDKVYFSDMGNNCFDEDAQVTIRINLREGIAPNYFFYALKEKLKQDIRNASDEEYRKKLEIFSQEIEDHYFVTFGSSDCLLLSGKSLSSYLQLHAAGQLLNPGTEFFERYIANVRTSVRIKGSSYNDFGQTNVAKRNLETYDKEFKKFIKAYEKFLKENNMPIRSSKAMQQIMKNFLNIAHAGHSFDAAHVLGRAFLSLIHNMQIYISEQPPKCVDKDLSPEDGELIQEEKTNIIFQRQQEAVEALTIFKDNIGILIADLMRSDRPFIEGNTLTHPSIASATKLIFAYAAILEKISQKFNVKDNFTFIVTSGGCDQTQAIDLFSFSEPIDDVNKTILIEIPEMSLYDIQGTLFRLLHECMHFIGERQRKERYRYLVNALAYAISWDIVETEFSTERIILLKRYIYYLSKDEQSAFNDDFEEKCEKLKNTAFRKIASAIAQQDFFVEYMKFAEDADYYFEVIQEGILSAKNMIVVFKTNDDSNESLREQIYKILYSSNEELINIICLYFDERCSGLSSASISDESLAKIKYVANPYKMLQQNNKFYSSNPEIRDIKLDKFIARYLDAMMNDVSTYQDEEENICEYPFEGIRDSIISAMIESFADCGAISCLDMKLEDFLLAFIYESWDIDKAFPLTIGNILRLGADLKVKFEIEKEIPQKAKKSLKRKVSLRRMQGFNYKIVNEMIERVNYILERYSDQRYEFIRNEIEKYLNLCIKNKADWEISWLKTLYDSCDFYPTDKIYNVVNEMLKQWKSLCEE